MNKLHYFDILKSIRDQNQLLVLKQIADMQLFVLTSSPSNREDIEPLPNNEVSSTPLNLPFDSMCFELSSIEETKISNGIVLVGVIERSFNVYTFFAVRYLPETMMYHVGWTNCDDEKHMKQYLNMKWLVYTYLKSLDKCGTYEHNFNRSIMVSKPNKPSKKQPIKTSSVIFISNSESNSFVKELTNKTSIEWDYSFTVRGHWRKITSIGVDREGIRQINGYTWIKPYSKGNGVLKQTIRVVK